VQRTERLPLEPQALGGRRQPQWRVDGPSPLRLNGPGWPGSAGPSPAHRRMIDTGTEKNSLSAAAA
jgi:hypothetical protein